VHTGLGRGEVRIARVAGAVANGFPVLGIVGVDSVVVVKGELRYLPDT